jgi:hypothetical protein
MMNNENESGDIAHSLSNGHGHDIEGMRMRQAVRARMRMRQAMHDAAQATRDAAEWHSELAKLVNPRVLTR